MSIQRNIGFLVFLILTLLAAGRSDAQVACSEVFSSALEAKNPIQFEILTLIGNHEVVKTPISEAALRTVFTHELRIFENRLLTIIKSPQGFSSEGLTQFYQAHFFPQDLSAPRMAMAQNITAQNILEILGDLSMSETTRLFIGKNSAQVEEDSLLGRYLAESGAKLQRRSFREAPPIDYQRQQYKWQLQQYQWQLRQFPAMQAQYQAQLKEYPEKMRQYEIQLQQYEIELQRRQAGMAGQPAAPVPLKPRQPQEPKEPVMPVEPVPPPETAHPATKQGPEKFYVPVDATSFPIFLKYFSNQQAYAPQGHGNVYFAGILNMNGVPLKPAPIRMLTVGTPLPFVLLKTTEGARMERLLQAMQSPKEIGYWNTAARAPWYFKNKDGQDYMTQKSAYSCCTHWNGNIPLGDKLVDEIVLPGPNGQPLIAKVNPGVIDNPKFEHVKEVWTSPVHEPISAILGLAQDNGIGNFASPGWVMQSILVSAPLERTPLVFIFVQDAKADVDPSQPLHMEDPN